MGVLVLLALFVFLSSVPISWIHGSMRLKRWLGALGFRPCVPLDLGPVLSSGPGGTHVVRCHGLRACGVCCVCLLLATTTTTTSKSPQLSS